MNNNSKIYIAGHNGMVGSAIWRHLIGLGYNNLVGQPSKNLDLRNKEEVERFFEREKPEYVFLAAAKVGGIHANDIFRADFLIDNLSIQNNVISASYKHKAKKLLFLGSSCIYPKLARQPLKEEYLLTGQLEPTNEPYAIAKIAGIKLCEAYRDQYGCNFISAMPTNLYGPNDNYDLQNSHVIPALIQKIVAAKKENATKVSIWGTGKPMREFMHVDDLAEACVFLMQHYNDKQFVNVGTGRDLSIRELAKLISEIVDFNGGLDFDTSKPDGTPRKLMDVTRLTEAGWKAKIDLKTGLKKVISDFVKDI